MISIYTGKDIVGSFGDLHPVLQVQKAIELVNEYKNSGNYSYSSNSPDFVSTIYYLCNNNNIEAVFYVDGVCYGNSIEEVFGSFNDCYAIMDEYF